MEFTVCGFLNMLPKTLGIRENVKSAVFWNAAVDAVTDCNTGSLSPSGGFD